LWARPAARRLFSLPGIEGAQNILMRETAPGTYVGTYTVASGVAISGAAAVAQLTLGQSTSPVVQAGTPITIDAAPPTVARLSPGENATLASARPLIYGTYSDTGGAGVSAEQTRLLVNGRT
jgi:hypothetical protein